MTSITVSTPASETHRAPNVINLEPAEVELAAAASRDYSDATHDLEADNDNNNASAHHACGKTGTAPARTRLKRWKSTLLSNKLTRRTFWVATVLTLLSIMDTYTGLIPTFRNSSLAAQSVSVQIQSLEIATQSQVVAFLIACQNLKNSGIDPGPNCTKYLALHLKAPAEIDKWVYSANFNTYPGFFHHMEDPFHYVVQGPHPSQLWLWHLVLWSTIPLLVYIMYSPFRTAWSSIQETGRFPMLTLPSPLVLRATASLLLLEIGFYILAGTLDELALRDSVPEWKLALNFLDSCAEYDGMGLELSNDCTARRNRVYMFPSTYAIQSAARVRATFALSGTVLAIGLAILLSISWIPRSETLATH